MPPQPRIFRRAFTRRVYNDIRARKSGPKDHIIPGVCVGRRNEFLSLVPRCVSLYIYMYMYYYIT